MKVTITKTIGEAVSTTSVEGDFEEVQAILQDLGFVSIIGECKDSLPKIELFVDYSKPASIGEDCFLLGEEELQERIKKAVEGELKKFQRAGGVYVY